LIRLKLFLKANADVYDALHSCRVGGEVVWNGVNEVVRSRYPGCSIRLRHETSAAFVSMVEADGVTPAEVAERAHLQGSYWISSPYGTAIFETGADAIVLSIQPELFVPRYRHRRSGYLFYPEGAALWPAAERRWLAETFTPPPPPDIAQTMLDFERLHERLRRHTAAPILVFNLSTAIPGERVHCYQGLEDIFSIKIRRFNPGLISLSERLGGSIIDVDGVLARAGAACLRLGPFHLTAAGYRLVAEEVVRVLADLGLPPGEDGG
jgi:hypothetical protein